MLQIFFSLWKRFGAPASTAHERAVPTTELQVQWLRDPLSHPDLQRMSARELADLPLGAWARAQTCE